MKRISVISPNTVLYQLVVALFAAAVAPLAADDFQPLRCELLPLPDHQAAIPVGM
ncbi:MAG: hypothetical protein WAO83_19205 [Fuerstiella sp.]